MFVDRTVSPTYVVDAARATRVVIERGLPSGLYHCVNSGLCTWWEFAEEAARVLGRRPRLVPDHAGRGAAARETAEILRAVEREACKPGRHDARLARRAAAFWSPAWTVAQFDSDRYRSNSSTKSATSRPTARQAVRPGDSMPAA